MTPLSLPETVETPAVKSMLVLADVRRSAVVGADSGFRAVRRGRSTTEQEILRPRVIRVGVAIRVLGGDRQVVGVAGSRRRRGGRQIEADCRGRAP